MQIDHGISKDNPLRFGRLKLMGKSAAHFLHNPPWSARCGEEGTAVHSNILGGAPILKWDKKSDNGNQCPRRGKDFDAFKADNDPRALILTPDSFETASRMAASVRANKDAMRLLDGEREKTIYWDDCGVPCRGTPDALSPGIRTDLKTGETADPRRFIYKVLDFSYHGQMAWYERGELMQPSPRFKLDAIEYRENYIVAVEAKAPFVCTVFHLTAKDMDKGRALCQTWMEQLRNCMESSNFPGYAQGIVDLNLPDSESGLIFGSDD